MRIPEDIAWKRRDGLAYFSVAIDAARRLGAHFDEYDALVRQAETEAHDKVETAPGANVMMPRAAFSALRLRTIFPSDFLAAQPYYTQVDADGGFDMEYLGGQWGDERIDGVSFLFPETDPSQLGVVALWAGAHLFHPDARISAAACTANGNRVLEALGLPLRFGDPEAAVAAIATETVESVDVPDLSIRLISFRTRPPDVYKIQAAVHAVDGLVRLEITRPDLVDANDNDKRDDEDDRDEDVPQKRGKDADVDKVKFCCGAIVRRVPGFPVAPVLTEHQKPLLEWLLVSHPREFVELVVASLQACYTSPPSNAPGDRSGEPRGRGGVPRPKLVYVPTLPALPRGYTIGDFVRIRDVSVEPNGRMFGVRLDVAWSRKKIGMQFERRKKGKGDGLSFVCVVAAS